jgi:hypothetical protein
MPLSPTVFIAIQHHVGISPEDAKKKWQDLEQQTYTDLLTWLISDSVTNDQQILQLEKLFQPILNNEPPTDNFLDQVIIILTPEKQAQARQKLADLFLDHLEKAIAHLRQQATPEQNQAINFYLKSLNA